MYADYTYYISNYSKIPRDNVDFYLKKASAYMGSVMVGVPTEPYSDNLKMCNCDVADVLYEADMQGNISAENVDGYSVTYRESPNIKSKIYDLVYTYLASENLVYRGVKPIG